MYEGTVEQTAGTYLGQARQLLRGHMWSSTILKYSPRHRGWYVYARKGCAVWPVLLRTAEWTANGPPTNSEDWLNRSVWPVKATGITVCRGRQGACVPTELPSRKPSTYSSRSRALVNERLSQLFGVPSEFSKGNSR